MKLLDILLGTPYWVWFLLAYLVFMGMQALKKKAVPLYRLAITPMIFIAWSMISLYKKTMLLSVVWFLFGSMGIFIGYHFMRRLNISVDKYTKLVQVPGSYVPLALSCVFFLLKYCLGVAFALNPELKMSLIVTGFDAALSGLISGFALGRFLKIIQTYRTA